VRATTWRRLASAGMLLADLALSLVNVFLLSFHCRVLGVVRDVLFRALVIVVLDDLCVHVICIGKGQQCVPQTGAPAELNTASGITFNPGDPPKDIVFATPGMYTVVCTIHPAMTVTITVQ